MLAFMLAMEIYREITFLAFANKSAVGIIGGADGPTAVFLYQSPNGGTFVAAAAVLLVIATGLVYIKSRRETP